MARRPWRGLAWFVLWAAMEGVIVRGYLAGPQIGGWFGLGAFFWFPAGVRAVHFAISLVYLALGKTYVFREPLPATFFLVFFSALPALACGLDAAMSITQARGRIEHTIRAIMGPFIGLLFVLSLFAVLQPRTFLSQSNAEIMLLQTAVVGTGALGMTVIIISAGIDLSVGSVVALSTVVIALLINAGVPQLLAAIGGAAIGMAAGFVTGNLVVGQVGRVAAVLLAVGTAALLNHWQMSNVAVWLPAIGVLVVGVVCNELFLKKRDFNSRLGLIPFIATLGMMGSLRGVAHWLGDNGTIVVRGNMWLKQLLVILGPKDSWQIFPPGVWLMLLLAGGVAFVLRYTQFGRHVFAIGSNEQTARLCGVNVERTKLLIYMIGVGFAGLAGVLQFSYLRMGDSTTAPGMELNIIAAVVIGGASLNGGEGSIVGSLLGAILMTVVANGCTQMGLESYVQEIVTGGIIVVASLLDRLRHRRGT
jgi:ribose/xylose/arabinose/galactoside ABC-type transport system permease subunit